MSNTNVGVLNGRLALIERRLSLVSEELAMMRSRSVPTEFSGPAGTGGSEAFPNRVAFDADSLSPFAQGFSEREYDPDGTVFRWSGNGPICELRFFLDRSEDRPFRMVVGETQTETLTSIAGFVDYAPVTLFIERDRDKDVISGVIAKRAYTRLAVVTFLPGSGGQYLGDVNDYNDRQGYRFYEFSAG